VELILAFIVLCLLLKLEMLFIHHVAEPLYAIFCSRWIYKQFRSAVMRLLKKLLLYCLRWQMSTPTLWLVIWWLGPGLWGTIVANFIGALIFFWVDRVIFGVRHIQEWEIKRVGVCYACGSIGKVKRLAYDASGYDRREDPDPQYRCEGCSKIKLRLINLAKP
jgi:hypothetical protein